jgi:hypothetical protein
MRVLSKGRVDLNGTVYYQQDIKTMGARKSDPCFWCVAFRNMRLCDVLAGQCEINKVFVRQPWLKFVSL